MQKIVFVGLSGGVDSAVSAALLQREGYRVVGAFIKIWRPEFLECTWKEDRLDAMRVCAALAIPFREVDLSLEYEKEVVHKMIADYEKGVTPNPDILCNRAIKFGHFAKWAFANGADMIATGHYARIKYEDNGGVGNSFMGFTLQRGLDRGKDQSYFIYQVAQEDLARTLFPVGGFQKTEVRRLAEEFGLPIAKKHDSQGLCFVGNITMKEFLARYIQLAKGNVVDENGVVVGTHAGAALYTIGERHGFNTGKATPQYVVGVDTTANTVKVSSKKEDAMCRGVRIENIHWISGSPGFPYVCDAQARYREKPFKVTIAKEGSTYRVVFDEPRVVASGQSLVFYDGEECLGGGIIGHS